MQYVQTRFSIFWIVLRPLIIVAIFTFIFDKLIHIPTLHYQYPLFAISGLIIWNNFSFMVNNAGNVIVSNQQLIKKVYFPRLILILSKFLIGMVDVTVTFILLIILISIWKYPLTRHLVFFPVFLFSGALSGSALAILLNAFTIKHRDLHQFVPTLIGFMIWLTPVFYPITIIPQNYSYLVYLNPIAGIIQGSRWAILGDTFPSIWFLPSFICCLVILIGSVVLFIRNEDVLSDYV